MIRKVIGSLGVPKSSNACSPEPFQSSHNTPVPKTSACARQPSHGKNNDAYKNNIELKPGVNKTILIKSSTTKKQQKRSLSAVMAKSTYEPLLSNRPSRQESKTRIYSAESLFYSIKKLEKTDEITEKIGRKKDLIMLTPPRRSLLDTFDNSIKLATLSGALQGVLGEAADMDSEVAEKVGLEYASRASNDNTKQLLDDSTNDTSSLVEFDMSSKKDFMIMERVSMTDEEIGDKCEIVGKKSVNKQPANFCSTRDTAVLNAFACSPPGLRIDQGLANLSDWNSLSDYNNYGLEAKKVPSFSSKPELSTSWLDKSSFTDSKNDISDHPETGKEFEMSSSSSNSNLTEKNVDCYKSMPQSIATIFSPAIVNYPSELEFPKKRTRTEKFSFADFEKKYCCEKQSDVDGSTLKSDSGTGGNFLNPLRASLRKTNEKHGTAKSFFRDFPFDSPFVKSNFFPLEYYDTDQSGAMNKSLRNAEPYHERQYQKHLASPTPASRTTFGESTGLLKTPNRRCPTKERKISKYDLSFEGFTTSNQIFFSSSFKNDNFSFSKQQQQHSFTKVPHVYSDKISEPLSSSFSHTSSQASSPYATTNNNNTTTAADNKRLESSPIHKNILFFEKAQEDHNSWKGFHSFGRVGSSSTTPAPLLSEDELECLSKQRLHLALTNKLSHSEAASILGVKLAVNNGEEEQEKSEENNGEEEDDIKENGEEYEERSKSRKRRCFPKVQYMKV